MFRRETWVPTSNQHVWLKLCQAFVQCSDFNSPVLSEQPTMFSCVSIETIVQPDLG